MLGASALGDGWEVAPTPPGACAGPAEIGGLAWRAARVPGTVAGALAEAADGRDLDADDWWFRCRFETEPARDGEDVRLRLDGLATVAEVFLNGRLICESESMFASHALDVGGVLSSENELAICCRALAPRLAERRKPRARWRTRLVSAGNLRFYRTMLLGRAPGFAPGPPVVGPWRPVWLERRSGPRVEGVRLRARVAGDDGVVGCAARVVAAPGQGPPDVLRVAVGDTTAELPVDPASGTAQGDVVVPRAERWWPHTHGHPALYNVTLSIGDDVAHRARLGFRELRTSADLEADGPGLTVNGRSVFARGAVWTPFDLRAPHADPAQLRRLLERVVGAGMNMLRIPGTAAYESDAFYELCDELGILVWQDFMFANLDYPESDPGFMAEVEAEARTVLDRIGGRPCAAVFCGGSEVAQQVAMMGLDPKLASGPLFGDLLPRLVSEAETDAPYVPSTPWGGDLPFRTDRGVAHYYGVGAYRRPLQDARHAEVKFAAECLAFANVSDEPTAWKAGVPRDVGAGWDFEDVRDHYLKALFDLDPVDLRSVDPERYLELSRAVSGEVMADVLGEWRRAQSGCQGALILWLRDIVPGAGWGLLDHRGQPKAALGPVRRALAPVSVWTTDEGLGGVDVHVANDGPAPLVARLRVALYRDFSQLVEEAVQEVEVGAHDGLRRNVEAVLGHFVDVSWAYRFGPPAQDLIAVSLEAPDGELIAQAFRFPARRPIAARTAAELGLDAVAERAADGALRVRVTAQQFLYGVRIVVPGFDVSDDCFGVEPGHGRIVGLHGRGGASVPGGGSVPGGEPQPGEAAALTALNLSGRLRLALP